MPSSVRFAQKICDPPQDILHAGNHNAITEGFVSFGIAAPGIIEKTLLRDILSSNTVSIDKPNHKRVGAMELTESNESYLHNTEQVRLDTNAKLSICAYFLSKFDMHAVEHLGFKTRTEAMIYMSKVLGKENYYLKRRRDEFDVLTGSHRKGQRNRPPVDNVLKMHESLKEYTFQELADRVKRIIDVPTVIYPDDLPDDSSEYREGKKKTIHVNIHERNPVARKACINYYGATCYICGFDFGTTYGAERNGMIHVHHLKKISEINDEYVVDPINDLRPVCPNCHMVLHSKRNGCYTIDEIKEMLIIMS